jgi:DNA-binding response OmpR family regulator
MTKPKLLDRVHAVARVRHLSLGTELVRERGRVLTRSEIAEHVWDENFDPLSNLIDVHINRLRRKVDDGFGAPLIHTRRGEGYMLASPEDLRAGCDASTAGEVGTGDDGV